MNPTVDGKEIATQVDLDALEARVTKLEVAPLPVTVSISESQIVDAIRTLLLGSSALTPTPTAPAPSDSVSMFEDGKITGAPFVTSAKGAVYKFDLSTVVAGNPFVGFTVNMAPVKDRTAILKLGLDGLVYWFSDGVWRRFRDPDGITTGTVVIGPPTSVPTGSGSAGGSTSGGPVDTTDPIPKSPLPGSTGKVISISPTPDALETAITGAFPGDTIQAAPGVYNESVGVDKQLIIEGGGRSVNPGTKGMTFTRQAILDATGVSSYREGQGGFVLLADSVIRGWAVTKFGADLQYHDGTGGIRNNRDGVFRVEECEIYDNEMGIGPHTGSKDMMVLKNVLFRNNSLPVDPGYAHDIYSYARHLIIEGGVTALENNDGNGHAGKFGNPVLEIYGQNYFQAIHTSCIDIPHGTAKPFVIRADATGGTVCEKLSGDDNRVIFGYAAEDTINGNAGGTVDGATFIVPNDGQNYIFLSNGPVILTNCKFLYTDGTPVKPGTFVSQGAGTVTGLPQ